MNRENFLLRIAGLWLCVLGGMVMGGCEEEKGEGYVMPEEPEYAEGEAWYVERNGGEGARADVFYVAPTCVWDWVNEAGETVHFEDVYNEEQREALRPSLELAADIFADSCRFYAPYYRQITLESWMEGEDTVNARFPYAMADVERAFDYYCTYLNEGRPFILAGFSQGGKAVVELLKRMPEEVYGRLVAAYAIGYKISREELAMYPNLRAAQDSTDTGVVICYNSVADAEAICPVLAPSDVCINPLNWRTDGTAAALNDTVTVRVDGQHHVLLVEGFDPETLFVPSLAAMFKPGNYHLQELTFYQEALERNARLRTRLFLEAGK